MVKSILVVGGTSTAGSYFVHYLLKNTNYRVVSTYRKLRESKDECAYRYYSLNEEEREASRNYAGP